MYILDEASDKSLSNVILYLTLPEILELKDSIDALIAKPINNHMHISDETFKKEITICIYDKNKLDGFNDRSKKLILEDK